jgi:hypothetical protein
MFPMHYARLIRTSAAYDLLATAAFATPWTFQVAYDALGTVSPLPAFTPTHVLIANLLGSLVVVWSVLRLMRPEPILGLFDSFARGLFLTWELYYLLVMHGASVVWSFAVFEAIFGIAQACGYWLVRKSESNVPSRCRIVWALRPA